MLENLHCGGAAAGFIGGSGVGSKLNNAQIRLSQRVLGGQEYNNRIADQEYYASQEWRDMKKAGVTKEEMRWYRDNGITDKDEIKKAHQVTEALGATAEQGQYAIRLQKKLPISANTPEKIRKYFNDTGMLNDGQAQYFANLINEINKV